MHSNCLNILLVDDSQLVIERLFEILTELECIKSIKEANSYQQALAVLSTSQLDVVLMDIKIPGKNGIELLSYIKKNYPGIVTVMLTNQVNPSYQTLCKAIGCDHYIDKSTEFESIAGLLESYVPVY
ncbi:MAG: response regulator [Chitinophagaceae bacterium]|nr:MAG: response regulator [Chitinophagaceae bacterium]